MKQKLNFKLSDRQYEGLETETRRAIISQVMMIETPKYLYAIGAMGNYWTTVRYDKLESIGSCEWEKGYEPEVVDKWL